MNQSDREIFRMFILCFFGNSDYLKSCGSEVEYILDDLKYEMLDSFPEWEVCANFDYNYNYIREF